MWPRISEIALGLWLLASLFLFEFGWNRAICGVLIIVFAALSWSWKFRRAYLANLIIGLWLGAYAWVQAGHPAPPAFQSDLLTALTLLCFAIIPNEAMKPPHSWRRLLHM
jgi:Na+/proline symporter